MKFASSPALALVASSAEFRVGADIEEFPHPGIAKAGIGSRFDRTRRATPVS